MGRHGLPGGKGLAVGAVGVVTVARKPTGGLGIDGSTPSMPKPPAGLPATATAQHGPSAGRLPPGWPNPAHARAYAEFEQLWADLAQLQQLNKPVALPPAQTIGIAPCPGRGRRTGVRRAGDAYRRAPRAVPQPGRWACQGHAHPHLPDGSTLYVNANTQLRVDFNAHQRILHLDKGQVFIEVAADKERPLYVQAGEANVRVVGTGFDVRRSQQQLVVSVAHGQVAFEPDAKSPVTLLGARQRARYSYAKGTVQQQTLTAKKWPTGAAGTCRFAIASWPA